MTPATPQRSRRGVRSRPSRTRNTLLMVPEISAPALLKHERLGNRADRPLAARQHLLQAIQVLESRQGGIFAQAQVGRCAPARPLPRGADFRRPRA